MIDIIIVKMYKLKIVHIKVNKSIFLLYMKYIECLSAINKTNILGEGVKKNCSQLKNTL